MQALPWGDSKAGLYVRDACMLVVDISYQALETVMSQEQNWDWIIGSDLRGWLSRALIDAAISTVMVKFARALNDRVGKDVVK